MDDKEFDAAIIIEEPDEFDEAEKECENEFGTNQSAFSKSERQLKPTTHELISEALTSLINDDCLSEESHKAFHRVAQAGVVQTPLYHDRALLMHCLLQSWARVRVPSGHVIMVSYPLLGELKHGMAMFAGDRANETLWRILPYQENPPRVAMLDTTLLFLNLSLSQLRYKYSVDKGITGFRVSFSFHNNSALPAKLAEDNSWNCSVPYLTDFLFHLSCNMEVECRGLEDEKNCSYTSEICGPGYLTLGQGCFFYIRPVTRIAWNAASDICSLRGGRLAVLNTEEKWNNAVRVLPLTKVFVGIKTGSSILPMWYRNMFQWVDGTTAFYIRAPTRLDASCKKTCGTMSFRTYTGVKSGTLNVDYACGLENNVNVLCEKPLLTHHSQSILIDALSRWSHQTHAYVECPSGHYAHQFLACDVTSSCWCRDRSSPCETSLTLTSLPRSFPCASQIERVPYTLVCDHRADCADGSDEKFCLFPECLKDQFLCRNKQCVPVINVCDGWVDCLDGHDENDCYLSPWVARTFPPPAIVNLTDRGRLKVTQLNPSRSMEQKNPCPQSHFQCSDDGYCLPIFLRCNGVFDCPAREDETGCEACPGYYRCRDSTICLHYSHVCDGRAHCPQHDDELLCDSTCPFSCRCLGLSFICEDTFTAWAFPDLRYLDATGSAMTPANLTSNVLLIHLTLSQCGLSTLDRLQLPNLLSLHVDDNQLMILSLEHLAGVPQLRELSMAGNPLTLELKGAAELKSFRHVKMLQLDLSRVELHDLNVTALSAFPNLRILNLTNSGVLRVQGRRFSILQQLRVIDLRGCPMTWITHGMFRGLSHLQTVYALSFKVCCPAVLPRDFKLRNCISPSDEISSCQDLLRGNEYRICVYILSLFALIGNTVSFLFRTFIAKREKQLGYGIFVTHLSLSDFLMGVYLAIIGISDQVYRGSYLWNDLLWRHSIACKLAGFLSFLSSEVSALIMCLITTDRFLVLRFPFSRVHFCSTSAHIASVIVWVGGVLLASVPLLQVTSHWEFYSQTGICIPLPITRRYFAGRYYSFNTLIVFNFVVFVFICLGQLNIYWSVRANAMSASNSTKKTKDLTVARRLITVAMTDFLCWFPLCVIGLLASNGVPIPSEVNVAVAIFVLPLNSAVNPCLYTFNVILERRNRAREEKLRTVLLAQLKTTK